MLFKGTEKRPDPMMVSQADRERRRNSERRDRPGIDQLLGKVPSTHFALAYDVISDILRNSVIDRAELDKERSVIVEEIRSIIERPRISFTT